MGKRVIIGLIAYGLIAIVTFGHSASGSYRPCLASEKYCLDSERTVSAIAGGVLAGAVWPLYWSWEIWS